MTDLSKEALFTTQQIKQNHENYLERLAFYKKLGLDHIKARKNIIKNIGTGYKKILEVGTGKGYLTIPLAKEYDFVVSMDINQEDQKIALMNAIYENVQNKIEFVIQNCEELNIKAKSFDIVISSFTFHHLDKPFQVINEILKVFKNKLIITDFNDKGRKIIEKAHILENRKHLYANEEFYILSYYIKEKGYNVTEFEDEWQKILIVERQNNLNGISKKM